MAIRGDNDSLENMSSDIVRQIAELVEVALGEERIWRRWELASKVAGFGAAGVRKAQEMLGSTDDNERLFAAQVLGRVDPSSEHYVAIAGGLLTSALADNSLPVRAEVALAISRLPSVDLVERLMLLRYDVRDGVRLSAAIALDVEDDASVDALVALSRDDNPEVRSWATYRLASAADADDRVCDALYERLGDDMVDVRGEALMGLAIAGDSRARDAIRAELARPYQGLWAADAALELPDPVFVPLLRRQLEEMSDAERASVESTYEHVIEACLAAR